MSIKLIEEQVPKSLLDTINLAKDYYAEKGCFNAELHPKDLVEEILKATYLHEMSWNSQVEGKHKPIKKTYKLSHGECKGEENNILFDGLYGGLPLPPTHFVIDVHYNNDKSEIDRYLTIEWE